MKKLEKEFWKSKTFWAGVLIAGGFIGNFLNGNIGLEVLISGMGGALGLFGLRAAQK